MTERRKQNQSKIGLNDFTPAPWDTIETEYKLDPAQRLLVTLGKQAWQRWDECRRLLDAGGVVVTGNGGRARLNPLVSAEARTREALVKVLAMFNFGD